MKNTILLFMIFSLLVGCDRKEESSSTLLRVENLLLLNEPDSAAKWLRQIDNPAALATRDYAHWILLLAETCELLEEDMPFINQMEKAVSYYSEQKSSIDYAKSLFYLGRSYEEEKEFDKAMQNYLLAANVAETAKEYKLAGKIYLQAADLYDFEDDYISAERQYRAAAYNFLQVKDSLNYAYVLRDIGMIFLENNELEKSLDYCNRAYKIALNICDSLQMSSLTNRIGIIYQKMDSFSLSEQYLIQSIRYKEEGSAPTYLALANLYINQENYDKALEYTNIAANSETSNGMTKGAILYMYYLIEKKMSKYYASLRYYEKYVAFSDSIRDLQEKNNIFKVEKRYDQSKLLSNNYKLKLKNQQALLACIYIILICFLLVLFYQYRSGLKNKRIREQQQKLRSEHLVLIEKESALEGLEQRIQQIRENIIKDAAIWKKIILNSQNITLARKNELAEKDWLALIEIVKMTYISFYENLSNRFPGLSEDEIRFCTLLKLELNSQQLSILLNIQSTSVSHKRYRIMKKGKCENTNNTLESIIQDL